MFIDHRRIDLFGKILFEKAVIVPPFKKPHPMPDEACFLYIMEGEYSAISPNEQLLVKSSESVLMKCGNYLSQMNASERSSRYEAVAVHFFPDILQKVYENRIPSFLKASPTPESEAMGKMKSDILIRKYVESILFYFENPNLVNDEILILKLKEIILLLDQTKNAPAVRSILANLFNPTTYSFRETIEAHLFSNLSTEELAHLTNRSLSSFKREFKRVYQTSPAAYIRGKKISKAIDLLTMSDLRMTDIAYQCGFSDVAHFSKTFSQKVGITPTKYRLSHLDKSLN